MGEIVGRTIVKAVGCGDGMYQVTLDNGVGWLMLTFSAKQDTSEGSTLPTASADPAPVPANHTPVLDDFKPYDRVKLKNLKPKYLVGATATVTGHGYSRLQLTMDKNPAYRNWSGRQVTVTLNMVEKI